MITDDGWVSVKERRPLRNGRYLVAGGREVMEATWFADLGGWGAPHGLTHEAIEYWREMPEAPWTDEKLFEAWWLKWGRNFGYRLCKAEARAVFAAGVASVNRRGR